MSSIYEDAVDARDPEDSTLCLDGLDFIQTEEYGDDDYNDDMDDYDVDDMDDDVDFE